MALRLGAAGLVVGLLAGTAAAGGEEEVLPRRVRRVVLHVLGGPSYGRPERRWVFFQPGETFARWSGRFGSHFLVWTDGTVWPRHPGRGEPAFLSPPAAAAADASGRRWIAAHSAPVYSHLHLGNSRSLGIEVAHSGRSDASYPEPQVRSLAWLLRSVIEMSQGRLGPGSVAGHKDLDLRPAYVSEGCERAGCPYFVDGEGRPFRRRVDPPESLFTTLAGVGLEIPRPSGDGDAELRRAETLEGAVPARRR